MRRCSQLALTIAIALGFVAVSLVPTQARKPDNPGGGNGGGGSGDGDSGTSTTRFSVIELPVRGLPFAVSEPGSAGVVTVAIDSVEDGYVSAAFAHVERTTGAVLASGYLPEPQFVDPNDGVMKNGPSEPIDVNDFGDIVGHASVFDPDNVGTPNRNRAMLWYLDGTDYEFELLPLLPETSDNIANGINNWGDVVGHGLDTEDGADDGGLAIAILWDAETHEPIDLNNEATAAQG